ncbi:WD and tetratricopeptide repeats protein 1, partial [Pseudolycoriella hygida]
IETLIKNRLHAAPQFIDRLELEAILEGHNGCVNCIEWSETGQLLASVSDDQHLMIWDPFKHRRLVDVSTPHHNNIFSVKFLPQSQDSKLATGAGDTNVYIFDINKTTEPIWSCHCHRSRIKRLTTAPENPHMLWSSAEDGTQISRDTEVKCVAINPRRPELLAVGCNDPYARIYDRRKLSLRNTVREEDLENTRTIESDEENIPKNCVTYFCPGHFKKHLQSGTKNLHKAITYLAFSPNGTELLVNMGTEQIYLYDVIDAKEPVFFELPAYNQQRNETATKRKNEKYLQAITQFTAAIELMGDQSILYLNRATAYMRRNWSGDVYAALRDCKRALELDPQYVKAHFRLARALLELGYTADDSGVKMLMKDITSAMESEKTDSTDRIMLKLTEKEIALRSEAKDYKEWFVGHCNTTTDIKEANFFGSDGKYIVAGSDDGHFFIWERPSNMITSIYKADMTIVNCVQPHPFICLMATSGLDNEIRLWSPQAEDDSLAKYRVHYFDNAVSSNQTRMQTETFETYPICRAS